jgi:hypothetical protein
VIPAVPLGMRLHPTIFFAVGMCAKRILPVTPSCATVESDRDTSETVLMAPQRLAAGQGNRCPPTTPQPATRRWLPLHIKIRAQVRITKSCGVTFVPRPLPFGRGLGFSGNLPAPEQVCPACARSAW